LVSPTKINDLIPKLTSAITELHAPYIYGSLVQNQPSSINEQVRFTTPINGWKDEYIITKGGVLNNEDIQVINITSSNLAEIKTIINYKYSHIDNTETYKITGEIEIIPTPVTCGFMSGITDTITTDSKLSIIQNSNQYVGKISSLQIPSYCYNKNIKYIDLNKNKQVSLIRDPYYGLYSRNCYERYKNTNTYIQLNTIATKIINTLKSPEVDSVKLSNLISNNITNSITSIAVETNFNITYSGTTVHGFYKDILIDLENIFKNQGYNLTYNYTSYYIQSGVIIRANEQTMCSKNFLTLANNAYFESLLGFTEKDQTFTSNANDFSIEITEGK
jgi:hypothetical protein